MYRVFFLCVAGWMTVTPVWGSIVDSRLFINELHYDNLGADRGEFVEVVVPDSWDDLSAVTLTLYNGGTGRAYSGPVGVDSFRRGETAGGWTCYVLELVLQNGPRDGLALWDGTQVVQLLSYEGTFVAQDGPAQGLLSTDIGVQEPSDTLVGNSLQLAGVGDSLEDFTWQAAMPSSPGWFNELQTLRAARSVPEPTAAGLWLGLLLLGLVLQPWFTAAGRRSAA